MAWIVRFVLAKQVKMWYLTDKHSAASHKMGAVKIAPLGKNSHNATKGTYFLPTIEKCKPSFLRPSGIYHRHTMATKGAGVPPPKFWSSGTTLMNFVDQWVCGNNGLHRIKLSSYGLPILMGYAGLRCTTVSRDFLEISIFGINNEIYFGKTGQNVIFNRNFVNQWCHLNEFCGINIKSYQD